MDPVLIMDDIIEKLHLLDYLNIFCKIYRKPAISRTYFAMPSVTEPAGEKIRYFVELSYWLMSLCYEGQASSSSEVDTSTLSGKYSFACVICAKFSI
jgi:hypothetical protein